jgi:hypothetical protein
MSARSLLVIALLLSFPSAAEVSAYAGQQARGIKALSQTEVEGLLQGKGMELAKTAELNSYPGPAHALELVAELGLTQITLRR